MASSAQTEVGPRRRHQWGGFLGNAAATAAGVAGGAFLFQGLEDLLGHRNGGFLGASVPSETVENVSVNNYNDVGDASVDAKDTDGDSDEDYQDDPDSASDDSSWT